MGVPGGPTPPPTPGRVTWRLLRRSALSAQYSVILSVRPPASYLTFEMQSLSYPNDAASYQKPISFYCKVGRFTQYRAALSLIEVNYINSKTQRISFRLPS